MTSSNARSRRAVLVTLFIGLPLSVVFLWLSTREARPRRRMADDRQCAPLASRGDRGPRRSDVRPAGASLAPHRPRGSLPNRQVLEMLVSGLAVNNVIPGRIGDLLRANWIARATGSPGGRGSHRHARSGGDLVVLVASLVPLPPARLPYRMGRSARHRCCDRPWRFRHRGVAQRTVYVRHRRGASSRAGPMRRLAHDTLAGLSEPMPTVEAAAPGLSVAAWLAWSAAAILCASAIGSSSAWSRLSSWPAS